jgi:DNA-binding CsgD family transcriptional regulator
VYNSGERSFFFGGNMSLSDTKVIELYTMGKSCAEVAQIDGCSETSVYNRLKQLNITMRSRSEANQIFPDTTFISLYNLGLSASQIGRLLGVDSSTVKKRLKNIQFPLRSRCVASRIRYTEEEFKQYFMVPEILDQLAELTC